MTKKKTDAQFKQEVKKLVGNEYTFLEPYVNAITKLKVKHNRCSNVYEVTPNNFLRGKRCPYCSVSGRDSKTDAEFKQEVKNLVGDEYIFLDTYRGNRFKLRVKHNKCGYTYTVAPYSFLNGSRCPYCYIEAERKTNSQFRQEVYDLVGDEYTFLDSYINTYTKIKVKHNRCSNVYEVQPYAFLHGNRCPYCNSPKGEVTINKILKSLGIKYEYQKTFDDLRDSQPLSYDFYIPDQNILIEYQGIQHYEPIDYFGGEARFKLQQQHDKMKSDYAKSHHYNLIAVPYTEDAFSNIKKYLIKHGLTN